ncbi:TonB-dependent receptor [Lutibacter sp. TH_r2]|uniref:SusC/RagA family TonB-linked outer membrane protein n=1 Tax=Lutibacter sp. TH_r2 TaxID=3082083 RepID=UPI002955D348|nr:TonB-dependent receptor [Lutibacter sp. TH_r2]MDV7188469.1 TonB-dependent receptor [Lutibacter sp. TH_r2]
MKFNELSSLKASFKYVVFFMLISFSSFAQKSVVKGKVTSQMGDPIPGVSVVLKGTEKGVVTDFDGMYQINIQKSSNSILVFSYIGMKTIEKNVSGKSEINVSLIENVTAMDEVVIVGYGSQQKKDITGSVSIVKADDFETRPNNQVGALLQGKAPGVEVLSSSGKPSQGLSIRIRGTNSIQSGSEPLYVVDGVPTTDTRSINPSDIESITILKDASSAAIYGAQGANGVVIISTKRGTSSKPTITFDTYMGVSKVWNTLTVLNGEQYRDLMTEMGQTTDWDKYNENTDWQKEIFQTGLSQNYQISIGGSNNGTNYYISGGYLKQEGAVRSSEMNRANFKINLEQKINDWLKVGTRFAYSKYSDVDVNDSSSTNNGGVLLGALATPSVIGIYNEDGTFTSNPFQNWENPIASTDGSERGYSNRRFLGNVYVEIDFLKNFTFRSNFGIDDSNGTYEYFLDPYRTSYGRALSGQGIYNTDNSFYSIIENTLKYKTEIDKHKIEALVGSVNQKNNWENSSIERRNFASDGVQTVNGGSEVFAATAYKSEKANSSFIGRLNYDYNNKYLATVNFRADGSSIFGSDERWGYFPSFSLGWRLSEEKFIKDIDAISNLKLRTGWGIVGNDQIDNYAYYGRVGSGANYPIGGVTMPGTYPASIENLKLKWEESEQTNIGIDLGLFKGKLLFTADAYIKKTRDLLLNAPLPKSTGYDSAVQNIGELENKGLEFSLNTTNIDKEDLKWTTSFNISFNENEVTNLVGQQLFQGSIAGRGEATLVKEGLPLGTLYGYVYGGVDSATGNAYYIDSDGASTFNPTSDDRRIIGDANADFTYSINNTLSYKGFGLTVFLQGSQGNDMLNATRIEAEGMIDPKNQSIAVMDRWRNPGDVTIVPKASWGNTDNSRISTRFIEDASYLRFKTISLSYNFNQELLDKLQLGSLRVYLTGENLFTITDYSGFDPEVNAYGGSNTVRGIDYGTYPQTRNIIFGLSTSF